MVQQEYIRFLYFQEHRSIREISRMTWHHRKTIRRYLQAPRERREGPAEPRYPVLGPYRGIIDRWLEDDRQVKPKQRHTARRIYHRLREEYSYTGGESTLREYVRKRRQLMGSQEVYLPLAFSRAESMQVDWGTVTVKVQGESRQVWMGEDHSATSPGPHAELLLSSAEVRSGPHRRVRGQRGLITCRHLALRWEPAEPLSLPRHSRSILLPAHAQGLSGLQITEDRREIIQVFAAISLMLKGNHGERRNTFP